MTVYVSLMSGEQLSFDTFKGYKFGNLRGEFYDRMETELSIKELESVLIFDENDMCDMNDYVTEEKTYNILVSDICVTLLYDETNNRISLQHDYQSFPKQATIKLSKANTNKTFICMYNELVQYFQEAIDFFDMDPDNYYRENTLPTFDDYILEKYSGEPDFEELVREYLSYCISKNFKIDGFIYE